MPASGISWKNGPGRGLFEVLFAGQEGRERYDGATGHFNPNLGTTTITGSGKVVSESTQYLLSANYVLTSTYLDFLRVKGKSRVLAEADVFAFNNQIGTWSAVDQSSRSRPPRATPTRSGSIRSGSTWGRTSRRTTAS